MSASANIQQRVFEAIPEAPLEITLHSLYLLLPYRHRSIQNAIANLRALHLVEAVADQRCVYRRRANATMPTDQRGWPKGKPRHAT